MRNRIPLSRGLGSSAAATVGGLVAGNALLGNPVGNADLLALATEIEGHPDNAAAALLGGFTVAGLIDEGVEAVRFDAPRDLRAVLFIPELRLSTEEMRKALPEKVPLVDAVANLGAVGLGVAGLATGRYDLLRLLTVDRLHEPYRASVYPQTPRVDRRGPGGRRARGLPVGRRLDDPRIRGLDERHLPDRGRLRGRRRGPRPARPHRGRRTAQPRRPRHRPGLTATQDVLS